MPPDSAPTPFTTQPSLFPRETVPYIIVAPKYNAASAGICALHLLCHSLNLIGQRAWIAIYPQVIWDDRRNYTAPGLCTPLISRDQLRSFKDSGQSPIVVYPETVCGNPLGADNVVRWMLNYAGLLGGDKTFDPGELLYAYSKRLAESVGTGADRVLFLPTSNPRIFFPPPDNMLRSGSCFYASKYRNHHHGTLMPITAHSREITRDLPDSPTKLQIAELFRRSEVFYTYEDTALAIEAGMCGCPTVFIPNEYLSRPLGFDDLGMDGFAWGVGDDDIARAKATVHRFPTNYQALIQNYWRQLERFAEHTQHAARARQAQGRPCPDIKMPYSLKRHMYMNTLRRHGLKLFIHKLHYEVRKRGFGTMVKHSVRNLLGL